MKHWHRFSIVRVFPLNISGGGSRPMRILDSRLSTNHRPPFQAHFILWLILKAATVLQFSQSKPDGNWLGLVDSVVCHLTISWLPLGFHLKTTWLPIDFHLPSTWLPLDCHLTTNWLQLDYHLTTTEYNYSKAIDTLLRLRPYYVISSTLLTTTWLPLDYNLTTTWLPLNIIIVKLSTRSWGSAPIT